jgi:hypothetical protein
MPDTEINPFAAPTAELVRESSTNDQRQGITGPSGIGGWLIIPMIGLIGSLIILVRQILNYIPIFKSNTWAKITVYPMWGPLILAEFIFNILLFCFCIFLLIIFFKKSSKFPFLYTVRLVIAPIFIIFDLVIAHQIPAIPKNSISATTNELIKGIIAAAIWIPYFKVSNRVKNTFRCSAT